MRNSIRIHAFALALTGTVAAQGSVVLSFGTLTGTPLTSLAAPAVGASATISVFYTSTTPISAAEVFTAFDRSATQGTGATKLDGRVGLSSPVAPTGTTLSGIVMAGGANTTATPSGTARPYGLDVQGVTATSGNLIAASSPTKLFDMTLGNLALAPGGSTTLSFYVAPTASLFASQFFDDNANAVAVTGSSLVVTAAPVPEPAPMLALAGGALALLRRRRRA